MPPDAPDPSMPLREELDALRRRLDDHGTLLRKNQQAVAELAESVGRMVTGQRRRERWMNVNSFAAYLIFTLLLGGAFLTLYRSRARELVHARDAAVHERDDARTRARTLDETLARRDAGTQSAFAYFNLLQEGKRAEAVARYGELDPAALTPTEKAVFEQGHKQAREALVDAGYLAGLDAAKDGDHGKAIGELRRALAYEEEGPRAAQMRYYLGVALVKTKDPEKGKRELELALAGRVEQGGAVDARFWLASALEAMGDLAAARTEYDRFASAQPTHPLSVAARRKAMALARKAAPTN
jgi:tetratricopeptide (TPR) repeat protein